MEALSPCLTGTYVAPAAPAAKSYAKVSSRNWAKIVKAPDKYTGKGFQVWACISQFDAATGDDSLPRAGFVQKEPYWYSDGDNAISRVMPLGSVTSSPTISWS